MEARTHSESEARGIEHLAQAMIALRSTADVGTACSIAAGCAGRALEASGYRLLRLDRRSGALRLLDPAGIEMPYLSEEGGPVEWVVRQERAWFDDGRAETSREPLLWNEEPRALAALPLVASGALLGCLVLGFPAPRAFSPRDRQLAQTLADALALTLERAELHRLVDEERARRSDMERRVHSDEESSASLMSLVAHEIRTPLTAIKAYTETLRVTFDGYSRQGKQYVTLAIGCTGGKHRSVAMTEEIARQMREAGYDVGTVHRDLGRE